MKGIITTLSQLKELPLGTKLYRPTAQNIMTYRWGGANPVSEGSYMLIHQYAPNIITGEHCHLDNETLREGKLYTDREAAIEQMLVNAEANVQRIRKRFFNDKTPTHDKNHENRS